MVTCDAKIFPLTENQSTFIPAGSVHRLENPGKLPLYVIEVQSGAYLEEDDIIRLADNYGRADEKKLSSQNDCPAQQSQANDTSSPDVVPTKTQYTGIDGASCGTTAALERKPPTGSSRNR